MSAFLLLLFLFYIQIYIFVYRGWGYSKLILYTLTIVGLLDRPSRKKKASYMPFSYLAPRAPALPRVFFLSGACMRFSLLSYNQLRKYYLFFAKRTYCIYIFLPTNNNNSVVVFLPRACPPHVSVGACVRDLPLLRYSRSTRSSRRMIPP